MFSKLYDAICLLLIIVNTSFTDVTTPHVCLAPPSEKCFTVIVDQKLDWNSAESYCEKNLSNGRLAAIHNAFQGNMIAAWLPFLTTDPWIGGFRFGSLPFQWTDASYFDYSNWLPGQPTSRCAQICHSSATDDAGVQCLQGKWRTADCKNSTAQILCEYGNYSSATTTTPAPPTVVQRACNSNNGKCFALVTGSVQWPEAERFCASQIQTGTIATLASVTIKSDVDIIATLLQHPSLKTNIWIGASAFGGPPFSWTDNSPFSFTNWGPGQPPVDPDGCVQVCLEDDANNCSKGKWMVAPCITSQSFVCARF